MKSLTAHWELKLLSLLAAVLLWGFVVSSERSGSTLTATVKVVPRLTGSLPAGFVLKDVAVVPRSVDVRGPRSEVQHLTQVETEPIDLSRLQGSLSRVVPLRNPGRSVKLVGKREVQVTLEVARQGV